MSHLIRPAGTHHFLKVEAVPGAPYVALYKSNLAGTDTFHQDHLTPDQAREYARAILEAADRAEGVN